MLRQWHYDIAGNRDLRIDWLRGLAMTCVIIDHSRVSSVLRWFSYERFWLVTAAEVFVVLSGIVLGTVYGRKLVRGGWLAAMRGLGRRALTLYAAFVAVTLSIIAMSVWGIDVGALTNRDEGSAGGFACFLDPPTMNAAVWRNVALLRCGSWTFQIVGLYVWLVAAAVPCLIALRFTGWRPLLAVSWSLYLVHRIAPHPVTAGAFESTFPILAWQLLFIHGLVIGYHRESISAFVARCPRIVPLLVGGASAAFVVLALCNPWGEGPLMLHWSVVSPDRFTDLYFRYFTLSDLGIGRILNLAVALPIGYSVLTWSWRIVQPLGILFITLGQQSLGAFVLHVYGILLIAHMPLNENALGIGTLAQVMLIVAIAALLNAAQRVRMPRATATDPRPTGWPDCRVAVSD
jgi:hypothetical protein